MILQPESRKNHDDIFAVAEKYLHQTVFTGWPHLVKAKVVGVSNAEKYIDSDGIKNLESKVYDFKMKSAQEQLSTTVQMINLNKYTHIHMYI